MGSSGAPAASFGQSLSSVATLRSSAGLGSSLVVGTTSVGDDPNHRRPGGGVPL